MKKVLLSLAFVLATGSLLNANNSEEVVAKTDCISFAFELEEIFGELPYDTFKKVVDACEKNNL